MAFTFLIEEVSDMVETRFFGELSYFSDCVFSKGTQAITLYIIEFLLLSSIVLFKFCQVLL